MIDFYKTSYSGLNRKIWLMAGIAFILRSGTMVMPFLTLYLTNQLHFSFQQAGICLSFFGLGSVFGAFFGGKLTDRFGAYLVILVALTGSGLIIWSLQFSKTVFFFSLTAFLLSSIGDMFRPAIMFAVSSHSDKDSRTRSMSLVRLAMNLGFVLGPSFGGWIAQTYGYLMLFWLDGAACFCAATLFWLLIPNTTKTAPIQALFGVPQSNHNPYFDRNYLIFIVLTTVSMVVFMQLIGTFPVYLKKMLGYTESQIGAVMALNGLLIAMIEMPLVFFIEKKFSNLFLVGVGNLSFAGAYLILRFDAFEAAIFYIVLLTIGEMIQFPFSNSYVALKAKDAQGKYMGLYFTAIAIAQIVAPALGLGIAERYGFSWLWLTLFALGAISAIGFFVLAKIEKTKGTIF